MAGKQSRADDIGLTSEDKMNSQGLTIYIYINHCHGAFGVHTIIFDRDLQICVSTMQRPVSCACDKRDVHTRG